MILAVRLMGEWLAIVTEAHWIWSLGRGWDVCIRCPGEETKRECVRVYVCLVLVCWGEGAGSFGELWSSKACACELWRTLMSSNGGVKLHQHQSSG